jgi:hypothetical protein
MKLAVLPEAKNTVMVCPKQDRQCAYNVTLWRVHATIFAVEKAIIITYFEYLENMCNEIMEFQRTGRYDLMYMKTKELG